MTKDAYFLSFSGGKDGMLALHRVAHQFGMPATLLNMLIENGERSRSHGLRKTIIEAQARALNVPVLFCPTSWQNYDKTFASALDSLAARGVRYGLFGDIRIPEDQAWSHHRQWADDMCSQFNMAALEPLWDLSLYELQEEFLSAGITAMIVAVKDQVLSPEYLGQTLSQKLFSKFGAAGIHPFGERGEYHTLVIDSPLFNHPLAVRRHDAVLMDGYWFLDLALENS